MEQKVRDLPVAAQDGVAASAVLWSSFVQDAGALWLSAYDQSAKAVSELAAVQAKACSDGMSIGIGRMMDPTLGRALLQTELLAAEGQAERMAEAVRQTIGGLGPAGACLVLPD